MSGVRGWGQWETHYCNLAIVVDEVLGQRAAIAPPILIVSIPEDTLEPSAAEGDQEDGEEQEEEDSWAERRKKRRNKSEDEVYLRRYILSKLYNKIIKILS